MHTKNETAAPETGREMLIRVGPEGDYRTITEAVQALPYGTAGEIRIEEGVYREKLFIDKADILLCGSGQGRTVIEWGDGADDIMPDGSRRGTFRSQTVFLGGEKCTVRDLTIRNTAGSGDTAGQALAVYADASLVVMERVELSSHQDTLFVAPLPDEERHPAGFFGPRMLSDRKPTRQLYRECVIRGDVDFIFGGAAATFEECEIIVCDRGREINGYVAAPSEPCDGRGMLFRNCVIRGEHPDMAKSVFLGRPWRPCGRAVFVGCRYDASIHPLRFSGWSAADAPEPEAYMAECDPRDLSGAPVDISGRNPWVRLLERETHDE